MAFKKIFNTDAPIVIGDTQAEKMAFPPGFRYRIPGSGSQGARQLSLPTPFQHFAQPGAALT